MEKKQSVSQSLKSYIFNKFNLFQKIQANKFANKGRYMFSYRNISIGNILVRFHKKALKEPRGIGRASRELFKQLQVLSKKSGTRRNKDRKKDVFFYPTIHWCPEQLPHPSCILILDVIPMLFPDIFGEIAAEWTSRFKPIAQQADKVLTISASSANDISRLLDIPLNKIGVISMGITKLPIVENKTLKLPDSNFIVYLGAYDRHKNIEVVFKAMLEPQIQNISLVMIGSNKRAQKLVSDMNISDRVFFLGRLKDKEVGYVISKALALVCPSLYEGFGLPPLEAALLGIPSICSSRPAMTEILNNAALFASPENPKEWSDAIMLLRDNATLRKSVSLQAEERARSFPWNKCSQKLVEELQVFITTDMVDMREADV